MKKIIVVLSLIFIISACHRDIKNVVTIQGEVKGMTKGMLHLEKIIDTTYVLVDTFRVVQDGKFTFKDTLDSPEVYYMSIKEYPQDRIIIFAEPGNITVNTKVNRFSSFAKIEGSENHKLFEEFKVIRQRFNGNNLSLIKEKFQAQKSDNQTKVDSIQRSMDQLLKRRYLYTTNFAVRHANMDIAPYLGLTELYLAKTYLLDTIANSMDERTKNSHYGKKFIDYIKEVKEVEANFEQ